MVLYLEMLATPGCILNIIELLTVRNYFKVIGILNRIEYLKTKDAHLAHLIEGTICAV